MVSDGRHCPIWVKTAERSTVGLGEIDGEMSPQSDIRRSREHDDPAAVRVCSSP